MWRRLRVEAIVRVPSLRGGAVRKITRCRLARTRSSGAGAAPSIYALKYVNLSTVSVRIGASARRPGVPPVSVRQKRFGSRSPSRRSRVGCDRELLHGKRPCRLARATAILEDK
jgi:hypothetical protein